MKRWTALLLAAACVVCLAGCGKETVVFQEKEFRKAELSRETLAWLEWYNGLSEEEQLAVDYVPAELVGLQYSLAHPLGRVYMYRESDSVVKPKVILSENNRFQFTFSAVSSYWGRGTYTVKGDTLVLHTDDGEYTYTFAVETDGDGIRRLIFDAENSSEFLHFGEFGDGAVFE